MSKPLSNHTELKEKILALEDASKSSEEILLNEGRKLLTIVSDPGPFIKDLTHDLARDKDIRKDLLKIGMSIGVNYLGKMISSPAAGDALLSFILKKQDKQDGEAEGRVWKYITGLLNKLKTNKNDEA